MGASYKLPQLHTHKNFDSTRSACAPSGHMHDAYTWRNKQVFNSRGSVEYIQVLSCLLFSCFISYLLSYPSYILHNHVLLWSHIFHTSLNFLFKLRCEYIINSFVTSANGYLVTYCSSCNNFNRYPCSEQLASLKQSSFTTGK